MSQTEYLKTIVERLNIQPRETSKTPYDANLFKIDSNSPLLTPTQAAIFVTVAMMAMYVSTRTRPEIKLVTGFLSSRLKAPTQQDGDKLCKAVMFINGTLEQGLIFRKGPMQLHFSTDASHGINPDGRGQVGCWGHLGAPDGAGVTSICVKAQDASSSAAMTEAIAAYVSTAELFWLHGMAEWMGHKQDVITMEQDNKSTIRIFNKGPGFGGRSKMFNIKLFWVTEQIDQKLMKLVYVPGKLIAADGFTKPKTVADFLFWMNLIVGKLPSH